MVWWVRQNIHSSWRVALACAMFVAGVSVAPWVRIPVVFGVFALPILIGVLCLRWVYLLPVIAITAGILGMAYGSLHIVARSVYADFVGKTMTVKGLVKEDISRSASGSFSIQLHDVRIDTVALPGTVLVTARSTGSALRGDIIEFQGKVREGFGSFPASITMNKLIAVKRNALSDVGRVVRDWFTDAVRHVIPNRRRVWVLVF